MKIECEIQAVRTSKKGDTMTVFIPKEHRELVVKHIMAFIEKPITMEILIDGKKVLEEMDQISEEQRKKAYLLIKKFADEYGDTADNTKELLKSRFKQASDKEISLSDCKSETASEFIEFILSLARQNGYGFGFDESNKQFSVMLANKKCFVCSKYGGVYGNEKGKLCLCDTHAKELQSTQSIEFLEKYHIELV